MKYLNEKAVESRYKNDTHLFTCDYELHSGLNIWSYVYRLSSVSNTRL